jgi:hypothetical protein
MASVNAVYALMRSAASVVPRNAINRPTKRVTHRTRTVRGGIANTMFTADISALHWDRAVTP